MIFLLEQSNKIYRGVSLVVDKHPRVAQTNEKQKENRYIFQNYIY